MIAFESGGPRHAHLCVGLRVRSAARACILGPVKREQSLSRLRRFGRKNELAFGSSAKRGNGSHFTVRVGDR